ncbi:MAG: YihA family ribosome biogenesis GTP-binding protein, partial [Magnetococcales bacterium]|nr:YihA family ribosome biogenesis GTP-binding protein [Magnetococcales bacterium]
PGIQEDLLRESSGMRAGMDSESPGIQEDLLRESSGMRAGMASKFITGAVASHQFPPDDLPELAFAGRSNVGKSSLLNRLLNRRNLAKVSRTPGRTREINFFAVGERGRFVDLPGYGFAEVGRGHRSVWDQVANAYFSQRRNLRAVILLLDLRRGLTEADQEVVAFLEARGIGFVPVATKIDKLNSNPKRQALLTLADGLRRTTRLAMTPPLPVSSLKGDGIGALWQQLEQILR